MRLRRRVLAGELSGLAFTCGTSNAAALATRYLARILEAFETPGAIDGKLPDSELHPAIAKALLIHAATWGALKNRVVDDLGLEGNGLRHSVTKVLGYGVVADDRIATATTRRVVLLGGSRIKTGQRHQQSLSSSSCPSIQRRMASTDRHARVDFSNQSANTEVQGRPAPLRRRA